MSYNYSQINEIIEKQYAKRKVQIIIGFGKNQ